MSLSIAAETLLLEGPDAAAFAHAQFSSKVDSLAIEQWQFSAWLDAKGRVRALFHLARLDTQRYLLLLRGGEASAMAEALQRFVFRSKLQFSTQPGRILTTGAAQPMHAVSHNDDVTSLGCATHSLDIATTRQPDHAWRLLQMRAGWPWLPSAARDVLLPAALSLQRLDAVAVDKGCYPGQEIVARLHFRGGHKRHLHRVTLSQRMAAGDVLHIENREVGCVLDVVSGDNRIEALVVLDDALSVPADAIGARIFNNHVTMKVEASWPA
ncbi:MAG: folate-binding protein [Rhodanobacter sp.]